VLVAKVARARRAAFDQARRQDVEHLTHARWIRMPAAQLDVSDRRSPTSPGEDSLPSMKRERYRRRARSSAPVTSATRRRPRARDSPTPAPDDPRRAASATSCGRFVAEAAHATSRGVFIESTLNHRGPFGLGWWGSGAMISR
jgi:hypothetical protein